MIHVRSLGASEIRIGRRRVTLSTEVLLALAFYLCVRAGERTTRDEVIELFWGTKDVVRGRHSLRQMLYRLRLKGFELDEDGEDLLIDPSRLDSDIARVLDEDWPETADAESVRGASELFPGFSREITPEFQTWLDGLRARVASQFRRAALRQVAQSRREGRWADLERWSQLILRSDPLNEEATLARAESAAMSGSKAVALEILDEYVEELGDRAEKIGLPAAVLRRRIAERRPEWASRTVGEVRFVGRSGLLARLSDFFEGVSGGIGGAVLLLGAPGVGKSRAAHEALSFAVLKGFRCVQIRALQSHAVQPLSALLSVVPQLIATPGAAGSHPAALAVLNRAVRPARNDLDGDSFSAQPILAARIGEALADLIDAIASESRLALFFDDLQYVDAPSREMLAALMARSSRSRVAWLATGRLVAGGSRHEFVAPPAFQRIVVPPLGDDESVALISTLDAAANLRLSETAVRRIVDTSAGNPLFLRELSLHHGRSTDVHSLPSSLQAVIEERLAQLGETHTRLLRVVALLGPLATVHRVHSIMATSSEMTSACIEGLENAGLISIGASRSLELHECWRTAVLERTSPAAMASIALECARELEEVRDTMDHQMALWHAAELYDMAGEQNTAVSLYAEVGDQLASRGLAAESLDAYGRALAAAGQRIVPQLFQRKAQALFASGRLEEAIDTCESAISRVRATTDSERRVLGTLACVQLEATVRLRRDHKSSLERVAFVAGDLRTPVETRQLACLSGVGTVLNGRRSHLDDVFFRLSREASANLPPSAIASLIDLIYAAERGTPQDVLRVEGVLKSLDGEPLPDDFRCRAFRIRATALRWAGHFESAYRLGEFAFSFASMCGLPGEAAHVAENMTFAALDADDRAVADLWMERWTDSLPTGWYVERLRAARHARARMLVRDGCYDLALNEYDGIDDITEDHLGKRGATDASTLALCRAKMGETEEASRLANYCREEISNCRPSNHLDYVVESTLAALTSLGDLDGFASVVKAYSGDRASAYLCPIAPAFRILRASLAT